MDKLITLKDLAKQINVPLGSVHRFSRDHADFPEVVKLVKPKDYHARPIKHYSQAQINAWLKKRVPKKHTPKRPAKPSSGFDNRTAAWFLAGMPKKPVPAKKKKTVTVHVKGVW